MAYMTDGKGPYPNKAGEYCGNHLVGNIACRLFDQTQAQANEDQRAWLATMRFGRPRPSRTITTKELEAHGCVGLYLKETCKLFDWETEVPTPPELLEPPADVSQICKICQRPEPGLHYDFCVKHPEKRDALLGRTVT